MASGVVACRASWRSRSSADAGLGGVAAATLVGGGVGAGRGSGGACGAVVSGAIAMRLAASGFALDEVSGATAATGGSADSDVVGIVVIESSAWILLAAAVRLAWSPAGSCETRW